MSTADLAGLDGILDVARAAAPLFAAGDDDDALRERLARTLGVLPAPAAPAVTEGRSWRRDGIDGVELTWETGIGTAGTAWLLRPAGETRPLPGVVALHCHGGVKRWGKEKIATGPDVAQPDRLVGIRSWLYAGRAYADDLARSGFTVLVPDALGWGSRRLPVSVMPARSEHLAELQLQALRRRAPRPDADEEYDVHAGAHEDALAKLLGVLGTSWAGVIAREDLLAIDVLAQRADTRPGGVAAMGLSGGGARAVFANALSDRVAATVVVAMMATMPSILDGHLHQHSWTMMSPGLARIGDWPEIASARRPRPLHVVYAEHDELFSLPGMRDADRLLRARYAAAGAAAHYTGTFAPVPHSFDLQSQRTVARWLADALGAAA